jgi:hypothetical protein
MKVVTGVAALLSLGAAVAGAQEQTIQQADVPAAVLKAVSERYPQARMTQFQKEIENGRTAYEVGLDVGGKRSEVLLSADGKLLTEEQAITIKDAPEAVRKALLASKYSKATVSKVEKVTEGDEPATFELVVQQGTVRHELVFTAAGELKKDEALGKKKD